MIRVPLRRTMPQGRCCLPGPDFVERLGRPRPIEFEVPEATHEVCFAVSGKALALLEGFTPAELAAMWPEDPDPYAWLDDELP